MQSQRKSLNVNKKLFEETVITIGTDDTDIIECSIIENNKENDVQCRRRQTPKVAEKKASVLTPKSDKKASVLTPKDEGNMRNVTLKGSTDVYSSIRLSLKNKYNLIDDGSPVVRDDNSELAATPRSHVKFQSGTVLKKLMSSLKKKPDDAPYLSKTKLQNIERWLQHNDVETVRTPPFANLSITPVKKLAGRPGPKPVLDEDEVVVLEDSDSNDSDVVGVLRAVYGDDWNKCKTEPAKKFQARRTPLVKNMTVAKPKAQGKTPRRNILKSRELNFSDDDLDDSIISGVKLMNFNDSAGSLTGDRSDILRDIQRELERGTDRKGGTVPTPTAKKPTGAGGSTARKTGKKAAATPSTATRQATTTTGGKTPRKTFLASLSVSTPTSKCHPDAQAFKTNFKSRKDELVQKLYKLYNGSVFDRGLPDDMSFSWNVKLRGTAGYCYNKRITKSTGEVVRQSRIEFSTKIVDRADRLRDTMIHELCHAASWVIDGMLDGHGPVWNSWAAKAMERFPELPVIKRCHNYDIVSKYVYRCTGCGYSIKRHSKSIDTERKRCGYCYGVLELLVNRKRKGKMEVPEFDATRTLRTPNKFALFVKENYQSVRSARKSAKHAEIMKILSQKYAETKAADDKPK